MLLRSPKPDFFFEKRPEIFPLYDKAPIPDSKTIGRTQVEKRVCF